MDYRYDNILVLESNEKELKSLYSETYNNIISCVHNRDNRSPMDYARDLVSSWLFEDYIVGKFAELGYSLTLSGKDSGRKILMNIRVGSNSDSIFKYNGEKINIEVINDYTGFWNKYKTIHLRDSKFNKLLSEKSILLAISITNKTFALIPITKKTKSNYIKSHFPYGGKPAYEIIIEEKFKEFSVSNIIKELLKYIKK